MRKVYQLQLDMNKVATLENTDDPMELIQAQLDTINKVEGFLIDVLKLDEKQQAKLDEMEQEETIELSQRVSMKILGMTDKEIDEALFEDDTDAEGNPSKSAD